MAGRKSFFYFNLLKWWLCLTVINRRAAVVDVVSISFLGGSDMCLLRYNTLHDKIRGERYSLSETKNEWSMSLRQSFVSNYQHFMELLRVFMHGLTSCAPETRCSPSWLQQPVGCLWLNRGSMRGSSLQLQARLCSCVTWMGPDEKSSSTLLYLSQQKSNQILTIQEDNLLLFG